MKLIVIGLGAVVILILVVVLAAMHYLRADDADDFDDLPDEQARSRGDAAGRDRFTGGRRPAHDARPSGRAQGDDLRRPGDGSGQRPPRDYTGHPGRRDPRQRDPQQRDPGDFADERERDYADGRAGHRTAARYDGGRGADSAQQRRQDSLPAVRPRQARGKRADDDGDWPSTEWDELSDVDYWAEVASDKPLTTTAQPASQARPARPDQSRGAEIRQAQGGRPGPAPRDPAPQREREREPRLPVRGQRQPAAADPPPAARQPEFSPAPVAATRSRPEAGQWPPSRPDPRHSEPSLAMLASLGDQRQPAMPDDDPLTSPSFPKIPASDSRSYHSGRGHTPPAGSRSPEPYSEPTQQFAAYASSAGQLDSYDAAGQQSAAARPTGYGQQAAAAADRTSPQSYRPAPSAAPASGSYRGRGDETDPLAGAGGYFSGQLPAAGNAVPVPVPVSAPVLRATGNPYGSYVDPLARSAPASAPAGLPGNGIPAGYGGYAAAGPESGQREAPYPPAARRETPAPSAGQAVGWYPAGGAGPAAAYPELSPRPADSGSQEPGYLNGSARTEQAGYPAGQEPASYPSAAYPAVPHDGQGYAGPDPYGRDPYGGYPAYGTDR